MDKKSDEVEYKYINLRRAIGILGICTPFILILFDQTNGWTLPQKSISNYYFTNSRDLFVGIMLVISFFFLSYQGYDKRDNRICNFTGVFALLVAVFPDVEGTGSDISILIPFFDDWTTSAIHVISAGFFFFLLAYISCKLFCLTDEENGPSEWKLKRNKIYKACGMIIAVSVILIGVYFGLQKISSIDLDMYKPIFILESIAILSFGISWLIKGETIYKDKEEPSEQTAGTKRKLVVKEK